MSGATAATDQHSGTEGTRRRLDSWKEIATHLKRGVRTVRRWERQEGLPVHRHLHGKQATVYAFADEIDAWLNRRTVEEGPNQLPVDHALRSSAGYVRMSCGESRPSQPLIIAILPLRNLSGDCEQERFADGLTEELISEVGHHCPDVLRVIALTSVIKYKQSPKSIAEIGRELGVDYVLEGGIRRYGRRVRLTARLIAARDQAHIWADSYEIQLPSIFSIQQALARQVADSLFAELHTTPKRRRHPVITARAAAHNAYIEGRSYFQLTEGDIKKSIERLALAIEQDSKFAPSYAELALAYFRLLFSDYPVVAAFRWIKELAQEAMKLDSGLARAHTMLAAFNLFGAWNWTKAEATSRRAIKLNPSDPWARIIRASYHLAVEEPQKATEELGQAHHLDPQDAEHGIWIAILAYFARNYDLAIERCEDILQLDASLSVTHRILAMCYTQQGDYAHALSHCETARELGKEAFSDTAAACSSYALSGDRDSAEHLLHALVAAKEQQYMRYIFLAQASVGLGNDQQTLEWLEYAFEQRDPLLVFLKADSRFDPISGHARFRSLLRRVGLPR